jgi:hypothetical protein
MKAPEITPDRRKGESLSARIEMKKRLFFYRVDMVRAGKPVNKAVEGTVMVFTDTACPPFPLGDDAIVTA